MMSDLEFCVACDMTRVLARRHAAGAQAPCQGAMSDLTKLGKAVKSFFSALKNG